LPPRARDLTRGYLFGGKAFIGLDPRNRRARRGALRESLARQQILSWLELKPLMALWAFENIQAKLVAILAVTQQTLRFDAFPAMRAPNERLVARCSHHAKTRMG
jgi:hypothetical protein